MSERSHLFPNAPRSLKVLLSATAAATTTTTTTNCGQEEISCPCGGETDCWIKALSETSCVYIANRDGPTSSSSGHKEATSSSVLHCLLVS
mmetsp:Transcript_337/g.458  ORF Transcript_337/g.458 Transcript_337/m.458 type:complete len:91 (-) Transcript_337:459-731(-)